MSESENLIASLVQELELVVVAPDTAVGEIDDIPVALTSLGGESPSLLLEFRTHPEGRDTQPVLTLLQGIPEDEAKLQVDDGRVWLTLYNLHGATPRAVRALLDQVAAAIESTDLCPVPGCLQCGATEGSICVAGGQVTRICEACLASAAEAQQSLETRLNSATWANTITLPGALAFVAICWAVFWTLVVAVLDHFNINVILIDQFVVMMLMLLAAGVGYGLGTPLGATVRRSIGLRRFPILTSGVASLAAAVAGEIGVIAIIILRNFGIFDLRLAAGGLVPVFADYSLFWVQCKVWLFLSIWFFCAIAARHRTTVPLKI